MRPVFYERQSEIGERSLIERSSYTTKPSAVDKTSRISERRISGHIHILALTGVIMQFAERAECFARHDEPDIADIVEGCHDIVSPIVPVLVDSRFPRDQFVSNILQILVILEEENGRELRDIV